MKLSELKTGERAVVVKVSGHGSFRKRIIEMGFVRDSKVKVSCGRRDEMHPSAPVGKM